MPYTMTMKAWRRAKGISETEMADRLGVTRLTVRRWETGAKMPITKAIKYCNELGIGVEDVNWNP